MDTGTGTRLDTGMNADTETGVSAGTEKKQAARACGGVGGGQEGHPGQVPYERVVCGGEFPAGFPSP